MRKAYIAVVVLILVLISNLAHADTTADGLAWLQSAQNSSGSWGNTPASLTDEYLATAEALTLYRRLGMTNTPAYQNALGWINSASADNTLYLAKRITLLFGTSYGTNAEIANLVSFYNGEAWGGLADYESSPLHTAMALDALGYAGLADGAEAINSAVYLTTNQNSDGGWGFYASDDSSVFVTATVLSSLKPYAAYSQVSTALTLAQSYLLAHQNADGGFGSSPSTVYETALALEALSGRTTDTTVLGNARAYLESTQSTEGSWNSDPYSTALALRALSISEDVPAPEAPTTGAITGRAVDAMTGQPLGSVEISSLEVQGTTWTSNDDGGFTVELPEGRYTFSFAHAGYITASLSVNIAAGELVSIGSVAMAVPVTTSNIVGRVTEAANGLPIAGARVELSGAHLANTVTAEDGGYTFLTLTPGTITLGVSAEGYYSVQGSAELIAGVNLNFNPSLTRVASGGEGGGNVPLATPLGCCAVGV